MCASVYVCAYAYIQFVLWFLLYYHSYFQSTRTPGKSLMLYVCVHEFIFQCIDQTQLLFNTICDKQEPSIINICLCKNYISTYNCLLF